jgi:hypothetical protein
MVEEKLRHCVGRERAWKSEGTETNSFNVVLGAWLDARILPGRFATQTEFADCSKAETHFRQRRISLGLSLNRSGGLAVDRCHR